MGKTLSALGAGLLSMGLLASPAMAELDQMNLKMVGTWGNLSNWKVNEGPFWNDTIPQASGGKITANAVPQTDVGIKGFEVMRMLKIGVFDVKYWGRDEKVAGIMLGKFMKMMKKKQHNAPFADSIEITVLGSDPSRQRKKEIILGRGFRKTDVKEQRRGETYRYEIPRGMK